MATDTKEKFEPTGAVKDVLAAQTKITQGGVREPSASEVQSTFLRAAQSAEQSGAQRDNVVQAMRDAADSLEAGRTAGPRDVVEVASGGGVIGHYDRNPVDSVVDTGRAPAEEIGGVQTAAVATPQGDASVLEKGAKKSSSTKKAPAKS